MKRNEDGVWRFESEGSSRVSHGHADESAHVAEDLPEELRVGIKGLPDALDTVTYTYNKCPLVVDPKGIATLFLKYTRGAFVLASFPSETEPAKLRRNLVGCLKHGSSLILNYAGADDADVDALVHDGFFPPEVKSRVDIFREEVWKPLLRPEEGDENPDEFLPRDEFKVVVITHCDPPPPALTGWTVPVYVGDEGDAGAAGGGTPEAQVARALGAGEVKRNSEDMVESAFDGELEEVQHWVEKGYSIESEDGHQHTPLSEAAAKGHDSVVEFLLGEGADPNAANDQGRSPLWRAAYNGHLGTVRLLLERGADPDMVDKQTRESPAMVGENEEVRELLEGWDRERTAALRREREEEIRRKAEERVQTAAERDQLARDRIRQELVQRAREGSAEDVRDALQRLADEADDAGEAPRGTANSRDERGTPLLGIAAWHGRLETVKLLLEHWKSFDADPIWDNSRKAFRASINARDMRGWTPVAIAAFHGQKHCLQELLKAGGDPSIPNQYGKTAMEVAKDEEIKDALASFGATQPECPMKHGRPERGSAVELQVELGEEAVREGKKPAPSSKASKGQPGAAKGKKKASTGASGAARGGARRRPAATGRKAKTKTGK